MGDVKFSRFINVYVSKQLQGEPEDGIKKKTVNVSEFVLQWTSLREFVVYVSMVAALTKHYNSILFSLSERTQLCCQNLLKVTAYAHSVQ